MRGPRTSKEAVLLLAEVLARVGVPPDEEVPDAEEMEGLPEQARRAWRVPETAIEIVRIEEGPRQRDRLSSYPGVGRPGTGCGDAP